VAEINTSLKKFAVSSLRCRFFCDLFERSCGNVGFFEGGFAAVIGGIRLPSILFNQPFNFKSFFLRNY
jgi:hypothetical protein